MKPTSRESKSDKRRRAAALMDRLEAHMPEVKIELDYGTPMQLLVSVILSAQCTDKRVNLVTPALFRRFPDAGAFAGAETAEVEQLIRTCGLYRAKAKSIIAAARAITSEHGGQVPVTRDALETLPGVGHKTAGVVAIHLGTDQAFPVDTHILRLSRRMGLSRQTHPDKVEEDLRDLLPPARWAKGHLLLIWHGRRTCFARSPECDRCVVSALCPKIGVPRPRAPLTTPRAAGARRAATAGPSRPRPLARRDRRTGTAAR
ncbi:MAG TPA: endonuclease III [Myxococcales bacterium]|nr:endonuclease III [Myxococcales bacterium]